MPRLSWRDTTRRRWAQDLALMAGALAAQLAPFLFVSPEAPGTSWSLIGVESVLISSVPVLFRRLHPGLLLLVSTFGIALYTVAGTVPPQPIWYGPLICVYTVAEQSPRWQRITALAATAIGMTLVIRSTNTAIREVAVWSAAYALGALVRARQEASAQRERNRIARDLHDILGHAFTVMGWCSPRPARRWRGTTRRGPSRHSTRSRGRDGMRWPSCAPPSAVCATRRASRSRALPTCQT